MIEILILVGGLFAIGVALCLSEKYRIYTEKDFMLNRVDNKGDNSYFFSIDLLFFQYRKREEIRKRYSQNSIIYCQEDDSYHRVLRWGTCEQGKLRIIVEPYIVEDIVHNVNCTVYLSNYGSMHISVNEESPWENLYQEILNSDVNIDDQEKGIALDILDNIRNSKVMSPKSLNILESFLEKYETIFSYATNVLSIISSVIGIIK